MPEQGTAPEDRLSQYLQRRKDAGGDGASSSEGAGRVEAVVAELNLPAIKEDSTTWRIDADVGTVYFGVDDEGDVLTIWQLLMSLKDPEKPKKHAEFFEDLLAVNRDTRGACLAIDKTFEAGQKWLMVLARLRAPTLDAPEFAMAMEDVFATSKMFDPPDSTDSE